MHSPHQSEFSTSPTPARNVVDFVQSPLNTSSVLTSGAKPLDQGMSDTCTCYAISNAIAEQLADQTIKIDPSALAQMLVSNNRSIGATWPHFYDNYSMPILAQNENNGEWISIKIKTVQETKVMNDADKFVLAYYAEGGYHCVFVSEKSENFYICVNSWKDYEQHPKVRVDQIGNRLWKVKVEFKCAAAGWSFLIFHTRSSNRIYLKKTS